MVLRVKKRLRGGLRLAGRQSKMETHHPSRLARSRLMLYCLFVATTVSFTANLSKLQGHFRQLAMSLQNVAGILEPSWPPWPQYTAFDYNYSVTNRGKMVNGKWTSPRNKSHTPPLFLDRLDQYLGPECPPTNSTNTSQKACDDDVRLFPDDIKRIEEKVMRFNIPHKIVLLVKEDIPYISLQFSRWHLRDTLNHTTGTRKMCPNCHIRNARKFIPPNPREPAHVRYFPSCSDYRNAKAFQDEGGGRDFPGQVLVGDCGESQHGSGTVFWDKGLEKMDYDSTFVDRGGPFVRTYAHLHLAPGHTYQQSGLPAFHTVSDFAEHLLTTPVPSWPRHVNNTHLLLRLGNTSILKDLHEKYDAAFLHGDCGHLRGMLLREMVEGSNESRVATIARYGRCFHNIETDDVMGGGYRRDNITKPKKDEEESEESKEVRMADMIHKDQEAHRDASKVALMSHHKFGFALENTLSPYYFTEKRWQVLIADSVPIVWNNDNSIQYLPDPDAALLVTVPSQKNAEEVAQVAQEVAKEVHYYAQPEHEQEYLEKFFAWKHRGLRPDFVRKLFLSTDFLFCRICEYMAHHHFYDEET